MVGKCIFSIALLVNLALLVHSDSDSDSGSPSTCDIIEDDNRYDCYPEDGSSQAACLSRGCCWSVPKALGENGRAKLSDSRVNIDIPYCYYPKDFPNYKVISSGFMQNGIFYSLQKENSTFRPNEILKLEARVTFETKERLRVQIVDPNQPRYEVPVYDAGMQSKDDLKNHKRRSHADDNDYQILVNESPFSIKVYRKLTGRLIFDTSVAPMIYADQYIQFSTMLPNNYFYGIGEHRDNLAHQAVWKSFTLWNRDSAPTINTNLYGTHPFYMSIDSDGHAMGFFLLNSNGMDVDVQPTPSLTFITIGGIIDFYVYLGPTPQDVVIQHTEVVGRSLFPQYFTLGFHLCRWKYNSSDRLKEIIRRNRDARIPYDVQWTDIDAMSLRMDWTYDTANFSQLPDIVRDLHAHNQYYVNIIDPAISNTAGYLPYESGLERNVFIKHANREEPLVGVVWPGTTVFPDFTNPNTSSWWTEMASRFHEQVAFDGIWIDMNEPSNFVDGSTVGCTNSTYDNPPYTPRVMGVELDSRTVCPSARQYLSNHYNLHNMYGHFEAIATNNALKSIINNKRPFVLTRSSYAGTGQYSAHWSGDNRANWDDLYYSIPNMLNFNMFGVSQVGSDICGFSGDTTEELCVRWMQLGSFYPFMRNHNDDSSKDQDPAAFSFQAQEAMKKVLKIRYALLPYLYTLYYRSSVYGETVVRPLFFEFTQDVQTLTIDKQFLFGPALLITPVLEQGAVTVQGYFPNDTWYKFSTGALVNITQSPLVVLDAPFDEINVHIRGGYIVPVQHPALTTKQSRKNPFGLLVSLKKDAVSTGSLYWDDGESLDSIDSSTYNLFNFMAKDGNLQIDRVASGYRVEMILSDVKVYGVNRMPNNVTINSQSYDNFNYDDIHNVLYINYFYIDMNKYDSLSISWFY